MTGASVQLAGRAPLAFRRGTPRSTSIAAAGPCSTRPRSTARSAPLDDPTVHTVSVCPLGAVGADRDLECRTTAFVGPNTVAMVCDRERRLPVDGVARIPILRFARPATRPPTFETTYEPALLYRVPVDGAAPGLIGARGVPPDQFSLHSRGGRFRALLKDRPRYCNNEREYRGAARLSRHSADQLRPDRPRGGARPLHAAARRQVALSSPTASPTATSSMAASAATGAALRKMRCRPPMSCRSTGRRTCARFRVSHTVIRAEQAGSDIVLTGYRDLDGLMVTLIDLDRLPRIASSVRLEQRYESEGRSHAFNSLIEARRQRRDGPADRQPRRRRAAGRPGAAVPRT